MSINNNSEDYSSSNSISQNNRLSLNTIPEESEQSSKNISNSSINPNTIKKPDGNVPFSNNNPNRQRAIRISVNSIKNNISTNQMEPIIEEPIETKNINDSSVNNINNITNENMPKIVKIKETITEEKIIYSANNNKNDELINSTANQINNIKSESQLGNNEGTFQHNDNSGINLNNNVKKIKTNRRITFGIPDDTLTDFLTNNNINDNINNNNINNNIDINSNQKNNCAAFNNSINNNISPNNINTNSNVFNNIFPFQYNNPFKNNINNPFTNNSVFPITANINNNSINDSDNNINNNPNNNLNNTSNNSYNNIININPLNNNKKKNSKYNRVTIGLGDIDFSLNDPFNEFPPPQINPNINNINQKNINIVLNNQKEKIKKKLNNRITIGLGKADNAFFIDEIQNQTNMNKPKENEIKENPKAKKFKLNQGRITLGINLGDFPNNDFLNNNILKNDLNNEDKYKARIPIIEAKQINIDYSHLEKKSQIPEFNEFLVDSREIRKSIPMSAKKEEMKNNLAEMSKNIKSLTVKKVIPTNFNNPFNLNQINRASTNTSLIGDLLNDNSISSISVSKNNVISFIEEENSSLDLSNQYSDNTKNIDIKKEINDQIDYLYCKINERKKIWVKNIREVAETHQKYENSIRKKQEELDNLNIRIKQKQEEIKFYNTKILLTNYDNKLTGKEEITKKRIIKAGLDINEIKHISYNGQSSLLFTVFVRNYTMFKFITSDNIWSTNDVNSGTKIKFLGVYKTELFRNIFYSDTVINKDENINSLIQKYYNDTIKVIFPKESQIITVRKIAHKYIFASKISVHFVHLMNIVNHISLLDPKLTFDTKHLRSYIVEFNFKTIFDATIKFSYLLSVENPFTGNYLYSVFISKGDLFNSNDFEEYKKTKLELIWKFFNPKDMIIGYQYFKNLFEMMYYIDFCDMSEIELDKTYMKNVMMGYIYPQENYPKNMKEELKKMNDLGKRKIKINKNDFIYKKDDSELIELDLPPSIAHSLEK